MPPTTATSSLIINSPYSEPSQHWRRNPQTQQLELQSGRRMAGYLVSDPKARPYNDPGIFVPIPLVNSIRPRIAAWRAAGYPGVTGITRRLLQHWQDKEQREYPFFFCQLEAIETLIWLAEAPASDTTGIDIATDGGDFRRICCKLATGTGKTVVMAMLIAWQILNKSAYPQDGRFAKNILIIAPGLTVKRRLSVLICSDHNNYYDEFAVVPHSLKDTLRQGRIIVHNWHALQWETEEQLQVKKGVDKRGVKSDRAYVREVLRELASARNLIVINDEAHHAWRIPDETKVGTKIKDLKQKEQEEMGIEEATKWIGGLDRIHRARKILTCFDFSATPYMPRGKEITQEDLFGWIVSDFGLSDAIEAGLVKSPRTVVRDSALPDAKTYKSRLYHIYSDPEVKDNLASKAAPQVPLPSLVTNAYTLLGADWNEAKQKWQASGHTTPPVMITVANRTETAARIAFSLEHNNIRVEELCEPEGILHIDTNVLKNAEAGEDTANKKMQAERLREQVNTVGQPGTAGEKIQNVISVGMLSEGWDARTVTHIMGLRAFTSQLLCEQVIGRGLRRASYEINAETGLFDAEYVNVFGIPFTFLPHEQNDDENPQPPTPKTIIEPDSDKESFAICWPNVLRIEHGYRSQLSLKWDEVAPLELDVARTIQIAEMAPTVDGLPDVNAIQEIDLEKLAWDYRGQRLIFEAAHSLWQQMQSNWRGSGGILIAQLIDIVERFMQSDRLTIQPALFAQDDMRRRLVITLNMDTIISHLKDAIQYANSETIVPCFDSDHPIRSTGDMRPWRSGKPNQFTQRSHINRVVFDSTWESSPAFNLDRNPSVAAWAKNDHLGFEIGYIFEGIFHTYRPDFIVKLADGSTLVLEIKGQPSAKSRAQQRALEEWCRAVTAHGGFGHWRCAQSTHPQDIVALLVH